MQTDIPFHGVVFSGGGFVLSGRLDPTDGAYRSCRNVSYTSRSICLSCSNL